MLKRIIKGKSDVNQLVPIEYPWAYAKYKQALANSWYPEEVNMTKDIADWKGSVLTKDERKVIEYNLGFFVTADSLAANNIVLGTYRHITAPECRLFLLRQGFDEALHTQSYTHIVQTLGIDEQYIFNMYNTIPCIRAKDEFLYPFIERLTMPGDVDDQLLLESLIVFACIMEGLFFYVGFAQILSFGRRNLMTGTSEQYQYILRDESLHCSFGIDMINTIKIENPHLWDETFKARVLYLLDKAAKLEYEYSCETMPNGISGLNSSLMREYIAFITNRRCSQLGLEELYPNIANPFPWLSEMIDLKKEKNFFETRVIEYQTGGALSWE